MKTALMVVLLTVGTPERDEQCQPNAVACYKYDTREIVMREYPTLPAGEYKLIVPAGLHIPNIERRDGTSMYRLREFGKAIIENNKGRYPELQGVKWNALSTLGHEVAHDQGVKHY